MIWIIGGTTEAGQVVKRIRGKVPYIVTVATTAGQAMLTDAHVRVARMDYAAMLDFIHANAIKVVVDLSHPYASEVSHSARRACRETDIRYIRFVRESSRPGNVLYVPSLEACLTFLKDVTGCVFFTTGSKNIPDFEQVRGGNRFVYRILPMSESLETCVKNHVAIRDIVALVGPISEALNATMFHEYQAEYVVMKDSGKVGGTPQKIAACQQLGIIPVVIGRPADDGFTNLTDVIDVILRSGLEEELHALA